VEASLEETNRASTGISGLDDILGGGLTKHRVYLVEGTPGTGKTTLSLQFLLEGIRRGETGLYITLSETAEELSAVAATHGWTLEPLSLFELVNQGDLNPEREQTILHPSEVELGETTREVMKRVEELRPSRVVFDSLSEMRLLAQNPLRYRRQILALKQFFASRVCTVLMLDDRTSDPNDLQLHSIAHGVISLEQAPRDFGAERRRLRVVKMRGIKFRGGYHDFILDRGGLSVFPRLVASEHGAEYSPQATTTGSKGLDQLLGGGLTPGTNTLLIGPSGVGKTTTAVFCILTKEFQRFCCEARLWGWTWLPISSGAILIFSKSTQLSFRRVSLLVGQGSQWNKAAHRTSVSTVSMLICKPCPVSNICCCKCTNCSTTLISRASPPC
jgi:circadian clock protein KaiC